MEVSDFFFEVPGVFFLNLINFTEHLIFFWLRMDVFPFLIRSFLILSKEHILQKEIDETERI